jgi:hypothetical protein
VDALSEQCLHWTSALGSWAVEEPGKLARMLWCRQSLMQPIEIGPRVGGGNGGGVGGWRWRWYQGIMANEESLGGGQPLLALPIYL